MSRRNRAISLGIWLASLLACTFVIFNTRFIADLSAFMPKAPNERQQMLVEQLRDGIVARLILIGIEGDTPAARARISNDLASQLRSDPTFLFVQNGSPDWTRTLTYYLKIPTFITFCPSLRPSSLISNRTT